MAILPKQKFYAGVGSRKTPKYIMAVMTAAAKCLEQDGFILRSGGAIGADTAFSDGVQHHSNKVIYLTKAIDVKYGKNIFYAQEQMDRSRAYIVKNDVHEKWDVLPEDHKKLHARNIFQILGQNMDVPVNFTMCWTCDKAKVVSDCSLRTGGTGTAIKVSAINGIPVFNLKNEDDLRRILKYIEPKIDSVEFDTLVGQIPRFKYAA